jgi:hypothetical protein
LAIGCSRSVASRFSSRRCPQYSQSTWAPDLPKVAARNGRGDLPSGDLRDHDPATSVPEQATRCGRRLAAAPCSSAARKPGPRIKRSDEPLIGRLREGGLRLDHIDVALGFVLELDVLDRTAPALASRSTRPGIRDSNDRPCRRSPASGLVVDLDDEILAEVLGETSAFRDRPKFQTCGPIDSVSPSTAVDADRVALVRAGDLRELDESRMRYDHSVVRFRR